MKNIKPLSLDLLMDIYHCDEMQNERNEIISEINKLKKINKNNIDKIPKQMLCDLYIDQKKSAMMN